MPARSRLYGMHLALFELMRGDPAARRAITPSSSRGSRVSMI